MTPLDADGLQALADVYHGSPIGRTTGMRISFAADGSATCSWRHCRDYDHALDAVHGGLLATMLDNAGWFTAAATHGEWAPTAQNPRAARAFSVAGCRLLLRRWGLPATTSRALPFGGSLQASRCARMGCGQSPRAPTAQNPRVARAFSAASCRALLRRWGLPATTSRALPFGGSLQASRCARMGCGQSPRWVVTSDLHMRLLESTTGHDLRAVGRVVRTGRRLTVVDIELLAVDGTLVATATGAFCPTGRPLPRPGGAA